MEPGLFGMEEQEVSVFDAVKKYEELHPEFKGCSLKINGKDACPVFDSKHKVEIKDIKGNISFFSVDGIQEMPAADAFELLKEEGVTLSFYKSDSDIYFVERKGAESLTVSIAKSVKTEKAKELYKLPLTLYVPYMGDSYSLTSNDFAGKERIEEKDVVDYLKPLYRVFNTNKKVTVYYEKALNKVSVAITSGTKGCEMLSFSKPLFKATPIGVFTGRKVENSFKVESLDFTFSLPKIPYYFLDTIVQEFKKDLRNEDMVQIYWSVTDKLYYMVKPTMQVSKVRVEYETAFTKDILVASIHSHNTMRALFSSTDDEDEIMTGVYGVIGCLDKDVEMNFRASYDGNFKSITVSDLFDIKEVA